MITAATVAKKAKQTDTKPKLPERFDKNKVRIVGEIRRVWGHEQDVLARVLIQDQKPKDSDSKTPSRWPTHSVKLMFPEGFTHYGQPVSLSKGLQVQLGGFLREIGYDESLHMFLSHANKKDRIEDGDLRILSPRVATYLVVEELSTSTQDLMDKQNDINLGHESNRNTPRNS